jgi:tetratricopeptide (TPR) repeat protein
MKRTLRTFVCSILGGCVAALPLTALAQPKNGSLQTLPQDSPPSSEPKTKEQLEAQQHFQRAKDLYQTGSYREAVAELEAARTLDPKAKDLVFNLGVVQEKLGKYDEAIAFFRQYLEMDGVTASERGKAENIVKRIEGAKREVPATIAPGGGTEQVAEGPTAMEHGRVDAATMAAGAVAIVGLGVGATFGILALANQPSKSFVTGRDGSYDDLKSKADDAHGQAIVADVGFGVGVVAAAVTAFLYFGRTKEPPKRGLTPSIAPVASGSVFLLGGSFQ